MIDDHNRSMRQDALRIEEAQGDHTSLQFCPDMAHDGPVEGVVSPGAAVRPSSASRLCVAPATAATRIPAWQRARATRPWLARRIRRHACCAMPDADQQT